MAQNSCVLPLQMLRGGVADIGVALVPVQPPEEGLFPVEIKAVCLKFNAAEAEALPHPVNDCAAFIQQLRHAGIERGTVTVPESGCRYV